MSISDKQSPAAKACTREQRPSISVAGLIPRDALVRLRPHGRHPFPYRIREGLPVTLNSTLRFGESLGDCSLAGPTFEPAL